MAIPNYDSLNVQHSRNIGDTVASATTTGNLFTSAQRDTHLNNAIRRWMLIQVALKNYNALAQYISNETADSTTSAGVYVLTGLTGGALVILDVMCNNKFIKRGNENFFSHYTASISNGNSFLAPTATDPVYIYSDNSLYLYPAASFNAQALQIHYIKRHTNLVANTGSDDILVPPQYWHQIIDLAYSEAMGEMQNESSLIKGKAKEDKFKGEMDLVNNSDIKNS